MAPLPQAAARAQGRVESCCPKDQVDSYKKRALRNLQVNKHQVQSYWTFIRKTNNCEKFIYCNQFI